MRTGVGDADPTVVWIPAGRPDECVRRLGHVAAECYLSRSALARTAWAAASRATGTRNGEHDT